MINIDDVLEIVISIGGFDEKTAQKYLSVIQNAVLSISSKVKDEAYFTDSRIVFLAGVKACNDISLISSSDISGGITTFKVGDISITEDSGAKGSFSELYKSALEDCSDLIKGDTESDCFEFLNV